MANIIPITNNAAAQKSLELDGFGIANTDMPKRLLVASDGMFKTGKTDWAFRTMPAPIVYFGMENGHEGVVEKYAGNKIIAVHSQSIPPVQNQSEYLAYWKAFMVKWTKALQNPHVKTIVLDTATDVWELLRLAEFGNLNAVGDIKKLYPQINQAYRSFIRMAYDREVNLCMIHRVKKLYASKVVQTQKGPQTIDAWDGISYERAGFGDSEFLIQVNITHIFDQTKGRPGVLSDHFGIRVENCRQNMAIAGLELWGVENNYANLAASVFDTPVEDWM